jgi:twitching motility two-component system response regulator PilG
MSEQIPNLTSETRTELRLKFENNSEFYVFEPLDYQSINWLVNEKYLSIAQAAILIEELVKEVIESFLLIKEGTYEFGNKIDKITEFCRLDLQPLVQYCQKQLRAWQSLGPQICSPYQRPYFLLQTRAQQKNLPGVQEKLTAWMQGFSLRHLAIIMNQDELQLAQTLYPYIVDRTILLHEPDPPFDKLPKTFEQISETPINLPNFIFKLPALSNNIKTTTQVAEIAGSTTEKVEQLTKRSSATAVANPETPILSANKKTYTIVCVDDSLTMLKEIKYFLNDEVFTVITISNPVKALMSIIRHNPDLILLDINMDIIDGYELCRLLRNHSLFKTTPIIMVTGNKGIIDRVKAKWVGASGYLTKPFTRSELLKMVFRYLT